MEISISQGAEHIIPCVINDIKRILTSKQFTYIDAPELDTDWYNFTVLNIPENHPCRDAHQSFFCDNGKLLRTHTSNIESRVLVEYKEHFSVFTIGRTYRRDDDATHTPMFHQLEMSICAKNNSIKELLNRIQWFLSEFFFEGKQSVKIRLRPSYFPFTEPSYEIDMWFENKWLEIMGCGILHRNIFSNINQPFRQVMALGCGIERLTMLKYGIQDIRELYSHDPYAVHAQACLYKQKGTSK